MEWVVVQNLRVGQATRRIIRGRVTSVPDRTAPSAVMSALDAAGHAPVEAGIAWANHTVKDAARLSGAEEAPRVLTWDWEMLRTAATNPEMRQLNARVPRTLYARCEAAARAEGLPLREWMERTLTRAVQPAAIPLPDSEAPVSVPERKRQPRKAATG